jgi:hypothetical protein
MIRKVIMKTEAIKKEPIPAHMTALAKELIERNLVSGAIDELKIFKSIIIAAKIDDIRSYSDSFENLRKQWFDYVHLKLNEYGFVNGEPKENTWDKRPKAAF